MKHAVEARSAKATCVSANLVNAEFTKAKHVKAKIGSYGIAHLKFARANFDKTVTVALHYLKKHSSS